MGFDYAHAAHKSIADNAVNVRQGIEYSAETCFPFPTASQWPAVAALFRE
jgi:hypothetical protein